MIFRGFMCKSFDKQSTNGTLHCVHTTQSRAPKNDNYSTYMKLMVFMIAW